MADSFDRFKMNRDQQKVKKEATDAVLLQEFGFLKSEAKLRFVGVSIDGETYRWFEDEICSALVLANVGAYFETREVRADDGKSKMECNVRFDRRPVGQFEQWSEKNRIQELNWLLTLEPHGEDTARWRIQLDTPPLPVSEVISRIAIRLVDKHQEFLQAYSLRRLLNRG